MHHVDPAISWDELWGAFENAVHQGKIGYVGSSNFAAWQIAIAQSEAKNRHFLGLVSEQHKYSLNCRLPELGSIARRQRAGPWRHSMESTGWWLTGT